VLAYRPLELAYVEGRPLAVQQVSLVVQPAGTATDGGSKAGVGEWLRMLAVFSLPIDASALNLRHERYALARLVHQIAQTNAKAVELRVLQYGVTRARLGEVLLEADGWDLVHISGHGLPAGLLLEREDGRRDLVAGPELVELLEPAVEHIKLVVMSSCDSAAVTAAEQLRLLGITPPGQPTPDGASTEAEPLPALAVELVRRLDCAVLAMRYPVIDDFAVALAGQLYDLLLGKGQPLARALQLALPRVVGQAPTAAVPALSVATPALFGARAVELRLAPPAGGPLVFDTMVTKLAGFPPEPVRFVGRVGPMARANAALAPGSQHSGVLLHGMAGAGKTACALELAYGHEQAFGVLVWHKAPDEGHDITAALANFALDLERKLPGLQLAHLVDDQAALAGFLPTLTEFLERTRVLIVLDNLESLLTQRGGWRDERWGLVVDALVGHDGLSRVILTSRRRPWVLDTRVLIEPVHALSLDEAVLLARELPHLRALLDGTAGLGERAGRALVARTLAVVQGHPKLIELADGQAADPAALQARLAEADQAWLAGGTRVAAFLEQGESAAGEQDYLRVLEGWTRGVTTGLPEAANTLFHLLCCLEDDDRLGSVVDANWARVWRRLERPGEPPDLAVAVAPLLEQGLVAVERDNQGQPASFLLHPGVAAAGRAAAGANFQAVVDDELAAYWMGVFRAAVEREGEELGWLVLRAGRGATPYLLRRNEWSLLWGLLDQVLYRDSSPSTVAWLLPVLRRIAGVTKGTDEELATGRLLARALLQVRPTEAETQLRGLLATAEARERFDFASVLATDLFNLLRQAGRLGSALAMAEQMQGYTRRAGLGPWTQLNDEAQRLQILALQGRNQQVLDRVAELRHAMASLPEHSEADERVSPWAVREGILNLGGFAAINLRRWDQALALNAEMIESVRRRDAPALQVARRRFNDHGPLLRLGRLPEAKQLLLACRVVFDDAHDVGMLGKTLSALADLEGELGHRDEAVRFGQDALRYTYLADDPDTIAAGHFNLANYLQQAGREPTGALAHRLACAVVWFQMGSGRLADALRALALHLGSFEQAPPVPGSFAELCALVEQVPGVRLAALLGRLPARAADGAAALAEVLRLARELRPDQVFALQRHVGWWDPVLAGLVAANGGDPQAAQAVQQALATRGQRADWTTLAAVLGRVLAGERDQQLLLDGLDPVDTAIAQRALDALAGRVQLDPASWQALAGSLVPDELAGLVGAVVAAARGDHWAAAEVELVLNDLAAEADWAALAGVLRRVLAGERDPALTEELDEVDTAVVTAVLDRLANQPDPTDQ
jgi:tetratricopeptide (TPR) repeat protein